MYQEIEDSMFTAVEQRDRGSVPCTVSREEAHRILRLANWQFETSYLLLDREGKIPPFSVGRLLLTVR